MIGPYWLGDIPAEAAIITVERDPDSIPLTDFDTVDALVYNPDGTHAFVGFATIIDDETLSMSWPPAGCFNMRGVYSMQFVLHRNTPSAVETTSVIKFVVQQRATGWYTLEWARASWRDAPDSDERLFTVLEVAKTQVLAWAPAQEEAALPAMNLREAQLMQARNIWNSVKTDPANFGIGDEGLIIRPFPMDWTVKNMIRPKSPKPVVR
jgi:hypothetical protein